MMRRTMWGLWVVAMACGDKEAEETSTTPSEEVDAGADQAPIPGGAIALDGCGEGSWSLVSGPDGADVEFADADDPMTAFSAVQQGTYVVRFAGPDGEDEAEVTVGLRVDTVEDLADSAPGEPLSLRAAVALAQACPGPHTIDVAATGDHVLGETIVVDDPLEQPDNDLVVAASVAAAISGDGQVRLFSVADTHLTVEALDLRDGLASDEESGAAVQLLEGADLTLRTLQLLDHQTTSSLYGGAAIHGRYEHTVVLTSVIGSGALAEVGGGMLDIVGSLEVQGGSFTANRTNAGAGGALSVRGAASLTDVVFDGNWADRGGALHVADGDLSVQTASFTDNEAASRGGAVYLEHDGYSAPRVADMALASFVGNTSLGSGGALGADPGVVVSMRDSSAIENTAESDGGAWAVADDVSIVDCELADNAAGGFGGAVYLTGLTNEHDLEVTGSTFERNQAGIDGGALFEIFSASVVLTDSHFTENGAGNQGGAVLTSPSTGAVRVQGCTFEGNAADDGGGIYVLAEQLSLSGTTMTGNTASNYGGAVYALIADVEVAPDSSISDNAATGEGPNAGGGVCNEDGFVSGKDQVVDNIGGNFCVPENAA